MSEYIEDRNQKIIDELRPFLRKASLVPYRDYDEGKVGVSAMQWDDKTMIEVIRIFHKYKCRFEVVAHSVGKVLLVSK